MFERGKADRQGPIGRSRVARWANSSANASYHQPIPYTHSQRHGQLSSSSSQGDALSSPSRSSRPSRRPTFSRRPNFGQGPRKAKTSDPLPDPGHQPRRQPEHARGRGWPRPIIDGKARSPRRIRGSPRPGNGNRTSAANMQALRRRRSWSRRTEGLRCTGLLPSKQRNCGGSCTQSPNPAALPASMGRTPEGRRRVIETQ
jgi:hypothetical protein